MKEFKGSELEIHLHEPEMSEESKQEIEEQRKRICDAIDKAIDRVMEETNVVKPPIHIPLHELTGSPLEENMKRWLDGIKDSKQSLPSSIIQKSMEEEYDHNIVEKVSITDKAYLALYRVAETIYQHLEKHKVLIVQSAHYFGNTDVAFAMCFIKHDKNCIQGYFIAADWEYFKINDEETMWKPCYHNSEMLIIRTDGEGSKVEQAWKCILRETPGEDVSALKFFDWVISEDETVRTPLFTNWNTFKYELFDFLRDEYLYTVIDFLKDNSDFLLEDVIELGKGGNLHYDDPNDEFDCDFYIIYER